MVVALGPGKFYGSSLPRPRIYTDVKFNDQRVDPPVSVMDPLMSWAEEAHWSMGGLSFTRHRLQGRIEGNVMKLRAEREKLFKKAQKLKPSSSSKKNISTSESESKTPSPPPAPVALKRRRRFVEAESDEEEEEVERGVKRTARKLGDDFDRVADKKMKTPAKGGGAAAPMTRSRRKDEDIVKEGFKVNIVKKKIGLGAKRTRSSPRLAEKY